MKLWEIVFGSVVWLITAPKKLFVIIGDPVIFSGFFNWPAMAPAAEEVGLLRFQP